MHGIMLWTVPGLGRKPFPPEGWLFRLHWASHGCIWNIQHVGWRLLPAVKSPSNWARAWYSSRPNSTGVFFFDAFFSRSHRLKLSSIFISILSAWRVIVMWYHIDHEQQASKNFDNRIFRACPAQPWMEAGWISFTGRRLWINRRAWLPKGGQIFDWPFFIVNQIFAHNAFWTYCFSTLFLPYWLHCSRNCNYFRHFEEWISRLARKKLWSKFNGFSVELIPEVFLPGRSNLEPQP